MDSFKAFRIHEENKKIVARFEQLKLDDLAEGDVVVRVTHSDINFKDVLAATGAGKILRRYPLVGGIDFAGVVESSTDSRYSPGDPVLVTGSGLSETHDGGYAEFARVKGEWVIPMPPGLDAHSAMALGTAGFTAALAIHRMERNGQTPERGPIVVTGASGGVGSVAIDMLAGRGYEVVAVSGKGSSHEYLKALGAKTILARQDLEIGTRPLESVRFAGAIDNVGGDMLGVADPGRGFLGQHCEHRADRRCQARNHRDAVHPARHQPDRHQFSGNPATGTPRGLEADRHGPEAPSPGPHCHADNFIRRPAGRLRRVSRRKRHRPHRCKNN